MGKLVQLQKKREEILYAPPPTSLGRPVKDIECHPWPVVDTDAVRRMLVDDTHLSEQEIKKFQADFAREVERHNKALQELWERIKRQDRLAWKAKLEKNIPF